MRRFFLFLMCSALGWGIPALASSPGNPLLTVGKARLAVSAEWEQNNRNLDLETESEVTSNRYWLKGTYGLFDWLDLCGAVGAVDFDVSTSQDRRARSFESDHLSFGFGGGFKLRALHSEERNLSLLLTTNGSVLQTEEFVGSAPPSDFTWNEFQLAISVAKGFGFTFPYLGVSYSVVDGELTWDGGGAGDFRDPGGFVFAGIDFSLPSRYVLTIEMNGRIGGGLDEASFCVGISQSTK